jgi:hypothetical protein
MDDHVHDQHEAGNHYSDYHYYLTGFVDGLYHTIEVVIHYFSLVFAVTGITKPAVKRVILGWY